MKIKTDLYTKIMLTAIVALLAAHLVKDINFVEKANASALPTARINEAMDATMESISKDEVLLIFDNEKINRSYGQSNSGDIGSFTKAKYVIMKRNK